MRGKAAHPPRLALQQRQHVRPVQPLQHYAGAAVALYHVDSLGATR